MKRNQLYSSRKPTEHGQSTIIVALSLGVLLLLIIGIVVLCVALFTATSMEDYDNGNGIFGIFETQHVGDIALNDFNPDFSGLEIVSSSFISLTNVLWAGIEITTFPTIALTR